MNTIQDERPAIKKAEHEIEVAFCDLKDKPPNDWESMRRLHFLSTVLLTIREANQLLAKYHGECNGFDPVCLFCLPRICRIRIGREYSLVIYVETQDFIGEEIARKMKADEFSLHQSVGIGGRTVYRFWWD